MTERVLARIQVLLGTSLMENVPHGTATGDSSDIQLVSRQIDLEPQGLLEWRDDLLEVDLVGWILK